MGRGRGTWDARTRGHRDVGRGNTGTWDSGTRGRGDVGLGDAGTRGRRTRGRGDVGTWDSGTRDSGLGDVGREDVISQKHPNDQLNLQFTVFVI